MSDSRTLELVLQIHDVATSKGLKISTAESCTGGLVASYITSIAGASDYFNCGLITYSNQAKVDLLGVNAQTLKDFGAVSEEIAQEMAVGALQKAKSDIAVSITGIAGPSGGSEAKPVGTVCFAIAIINGKTKTYRLMFSGDRTMIRNLACIKALELLLEAMTQPSLK